MLQLCLGVDFRMLSLSPLISSSCVVILSNKFSSSGLPFVWRLLRSIIFYSHTSCDSFSCGLWDMNCVLVNCYFYASDVFQLFHSVLPYEFFFVNHVVTLAEFQFFNWTSCYHLHKSSSPLRQCLRPFKHSERWQIGLYCNLQLCLHF